MNTAITEMLGIKTPILQGAMAWIADSSLASAVSNAGGLGIIAAGNAPVDVVREEIKRTKELTDKPFGVNIMLLSPFADDIAQLVCDENVAMVTTGAGNPGKYMEAFKSKNIKVVPVVPSVAFAKKLEKMGADAIIAEGMESGGHIGKLTTLAMLPQIIESVKIPVIAAGGIGDGKGMAAALMLGAQGVQLGTRFLVAKECTVHQNYKNVILKAKDIDTTVSGAKTGHPVRVIRNKQTRLFDELEKQDMEFEEFMKKFDEMGTGALKRAVKDGDIEFGSVMSGQIAGFIKAEQTCKEMIDEITAECIKTIKQAALKYCGV